MKSTGVIFVAAMLILSACVPQAVPTAVQETVALAPTPTPVPPTATPTPEPTATTEPTPTPRPESTLLNENELSRLGYLPDFREVRQLTAVDFTIPYNQEHRHGLGWRIGGVEIIFDQALVDFEADFAIKKEHKAAGEVPVPNLDYPNGPEFIEQIAEVIHTYNLKLVPWNQPLPDDWQQRYRDYLAQNPDASYSISGAVPVPNRPGAYRIEDLGRVNPRLPIRVFALPPVMDKEKAMGDPNNIIYGGDPRAPFLLPYANKYDGYFGVFIDENGGVNIYLSEFNYQGMILGRKIDFGAQMAIMPLYALAPHYRSSLTGFYTLPPGPNLFFLNLYGQNPEVVIWQQSR